MERLLPQGSEKGHRVSTLSPQQQGMRKEEGYLVGSQAAMERSNVRASATKPVGLRNRFNEHASHQRLNTVLGDSSRKPVRMTQLSSC